MKDALKQAIIDRAKGPFDSGMKLLVKEPGDVLPKVMEFTVTHPTPLETLVRVQTNVGPRYFKIRVSEMF